MTLGETTFSDECTSKRASPGIVRTSSEAISPALSIEASPLPHGLPPTLAAMDSKAELLHLLEINPYDNTESRETLRKNQQHPSTETLAL
jgi:hypothetical protein